MRVAPLLPLLALTALAAAQRPEEPREAAVWDAYQNFRTTSDTFVFQMTGTETVGNASANVHSVLYWRNSVDPRTGLKSRAQVRLDILQPTANGGERLSMRLVGDGTTLFRYDLDRGTVSSTTYGFYGNRPPDGYFANVKSDAPKLLAQLRAATPGHAAYLVRLVGEMNLASGIDLFPRFASWSPGARPQAFDEVPLGPRALNGELTNDDTVTDPITGRAFVRGADRFLFYGMDRSAPARTVAFRLFDADPDEANVLWQVQTVDIALQSPGRRVALTITPQTGTVSSSAFQPFTGNEGASFRPTAPGV